MDRSLLIVPRRSELVNTDVFVFQISLDLVGDEMIFIFSIRENVFAHGSQQYGIFALLVDEQAQECTTVRRDRTRSKIFSIDVERTLFQTGQIHCFLNGLLKVSNVCSRASKDRLLSIITSIQVGRNDSIESCLR